MIFIVIVLIVLPLFGVGALALARRPVWAIWLVLGLYLFEVITVATSGINVGLHLYPGDLVFPVLLGAAVVRLWLGVTRKVDWVLLGLIAAFFFSVLRGFAAYGVKVTGVEARGVFYMLSSSLFFSTCSMNERFLKKFCDVWLRCCAVLLVLVVLRWVAVMLGFDFASEGDEGGPGGSRMRVVNAGAAFFLATGFFMSFYLESNKQGRLWQRKLLYWIGPVILLVQHRTVWVISIVAFLWMSWRDRRFRKWLPVGIALMAVIGVMMVAVLFGSGGGLSEYLSSSATNPTTFIWRLGGWIKLLDDFFASSPTVIVLGNPFGAGWARVLGGGVVNVAPHNYYVQILLRTGFLGLFLLLLVYKRAFRKRAGNPYPGWRFWKVAVIAQLIYNVTYGVQYEQAVLLGIVLALPPLAQRASHLRSIAANSSPANLAVLVHSPHDIG